jgi:alpha-L-arabinofuranosidase
MSVSKRGVLGLLAALLLNAAVPEARSQARATITIDAHKVENRISPLLYGQFLEFMYEGIKGGLHAELIRNRSFEGPANAIGLPRYWERYPDDRNDDYALTFSADGEKPYPPEQERKEQSLRVQAGDGVIRRHGVYQPRIPITGGMDYRGYVWLKTENYQGPVKVALESDVNQGEAYAETDLNVVAGDWRKYGFTLRPRKSDPLARFVLLVPGRGRIWLDQVSLLPGDAVNGVRRDVFEKVKALRPAFIRWPGGNVAQDYRWMWAVGARDKRFTWINLSWKNELEPSDFGTDEFIQFARAVGAEPSITVNVEGRGADVAEAAAWVEYCNGPATSKYGAMRAANGHPEPYGVKLWEVGNEIWGDWVRGHSDADTYARNYKRYVQTMRAVDPSIKFIAVGDNNMNWNRTVLSAAAADIDYLAIHHYYGRGEIGGDPLNLMARPLHFERFYAAVEQLIKEIGNHQIKLAINEWGLDLPTERQYSMESALYAARLMNVFERHGDLVEMSAVSDLTNGWPGGIIQAGRHGVFVSPIYLVNRLYNSEKGSERISATIDGPTFDTSKEGKDVPFLDAIVNRSSDGKKIFVKTVNADPMNSIATTITVQGAVPEARAEIRTITAPTLQAFNDFATPEAVSERLTTIPARPSFVVTLPKHSISVITLKVR